VFCIAKSFYSGHTQGFASAYGSSKFGLQLERGAGCRIVPVHWIAVSLPCKVRGARLEPFSDEEPREQLKKPLSRHKLSRFDEEAILEYLARLTVTFSKANPWFRECVDHLQEDVLRP